MQVDIEKMDRAKQLVKEIVEALNKNEEGEYSVTSRSKDHVLLMEYHDLSMGPRYRVTLDKIVSGYVGAGEIKPCTQRLMGFELVVATGVVSYLGHGLEDDILRGLKDILYHRTKVIDPCKEIVRLLAEKDDSYGKQIMDVGDVMVDLVIAPGQIKYTLLMYRGTISMPFATLNIGFDKDLAHGGFRRYKGDNDKIYKMVGNVLQDVKDNKIRTVKRKQSDA